MKPSKQVQRMWKAIAEGKPELLDDLDMHRKPRAAPIAKEAPLQKATVNFLRKHLPPGSLVWAMTNHSRSQNQTFALIAMGMLPGMPDLGVLVPSDGYSPVHGTEPRLYFIEMKAPKGVLSAAQERVQGLLQDMGIPVLAKCESAKQAADWLEAQGVRFR